MHSLDVAILVPVLQYALTVGANLSKLLVVSKTVVLHLNVLLALASSLSVVIFVFNLHN